MEVDGRLLTTGGQKWLGLTEFHKVDVILQRGECVGMRERFHRTAPATGLNGMKGKAVWRVCHTVSLPGSPLGAVNTGRWPFPILGPRASILVLTIL